MSANEAVSIRMIPMSDGTVHAYAPCDAGRRTHVAIDAAQYAELVAYAKTGEAVEGVLIEANEDDGTMTPADVVRALVAERDALREALAGLVADILRRHPDDDYPALVNARTALGAERSA